MKIRWALVALTILVATGCAGIQTSQDYDPGTDFQSMKIFRWALQTQPKTGDSRIDNPFRDTRIREAVERVLQEKGLSKETDRDADVLVRYQYTLRRRIDSDAAGSSIGFGIGSYGRSGGIAIGTGTGNNVREYDEGALVIDMVGPASDALLWRGSGSQRFQEYDDPQKASQDINTLVEKILGQFPPED